MSVPKRLIVVDDSWRFAVHVWRYLTGAMEFGFGDPKDREKPATLPEFNPTAPDGSLELVWHKPDTSKSATEETRSKAFEDCCNAGAGEVWCIIDIRGVPEWKTQYYAAFEKHTGHQERIRVMSSYGQRDWASDPAVWPKTVESLRELKASMKLSPAPESGAASRAPEHVQVLVIGAGFELAEREVRAGVGVGCPFTKTLLEEMRPKERGDSIAKDSYAFPCFHNAKYTREPAERGDLDGWWDGVFEYFARNEEKDAEQLELDWREAFRRSFLEYDHGMLLQSIFAAQLEWDYWLTTNYTRFTDRAIDLISSITSSDAESKDKKETLARRWKAITTPIEADAVAPFMGVKDLAHGERIMIKLHGDIGHAWTMAVAGQDKLPESKLAVRPQLHRMYAVGEAALLATLWRRNANRCSWHVIGHGLQDKSLVRLIATVVQRSPKVEHDMVHVSPGYRDKASSDAIQDLAKVFERAGEAQFSERLLSKRSVPRRFKVQFEPLTALQYMYKLRSQGLTPPSKPRKPSSTRPPGPPSELLPIRPQASDTPALPAAPAPSTTTGEPPSSDPADTGTFRSRPSRRRRSPSAGPLDPPGD